MPHYTPKDPLDANAPEHINLIPAVGMASDYWRSNYAGSSEEGVEYLRDDLPPSDAEIERLRDALRWVRSVSGCQASRVIAASALKGTDA